MYHIWTKFSNIASIFSLLLQTNDIFLTRNSIYLAAFYSSSEIWRNLFIKLNQLLANDLSATFLANFYITFYSKYFYQQRSQGKKKVFWFAWKLQYEQAFRCCFDPAILCEWWRLFSCKILPLVYDNDIN